MGKLTPGPDYKHYLSPEQVETEADFTRLKPRMARVGDVRTFQNFLMPVSESVDVSRYSAVIVWCESFDQFITAAEYQANKSPDLFGSAGALHHCETRAATPISVAPFARRGSKATHD